MYTLRPQQVLFEQAIREAFRCHRCVLGVAATGFGKSIVITHMAYKAAEKGRSVLICTNRRQIVKQLMEHCNRAGVHVGVIMGSEEPDPCAPVQVASIQTLKRRDFRDITEPGFIILDEAHQEFAAYKRLITEQFPHTKALGFTATPVGPGGSPLDHFDTIVEPIKNSEVIAAGHLLRVKYIAPSEPDMGGIDIKNASQNEIGKRVSECTVFGDVFKIWEPYSHMQTMVVLPSRAVCNSFHEMCLERGIRAAVVDGTTPQDERDSTFRDFSYTDCQMLLGVDVVREGLDLPIAQCLIDLQPTHQFRVFWQKIGRVKRPHDDQGEAVVIDLAGNLWRFMVHADQDPPWEDLTTGATIEEILEKKAGVRCPKCGSKEIYGPIDGQYKCEDCKHVWETKKPWVCPMCKQALGPHQRCVGGVCPNCGEKVGTKQTRQIRMTDGTMRTVPADEIKRRKKNKVDNELQEWKRWVFIAKNWNLKPENINSDNKKTLAWARRMFKVKQGKWPRDGMPYMPERPADWQRQPEQVYPYLK